MPKGELSMSCIFVCHFHLTSITNLTAVWAQACGLEHKNTFVIIVHLWTTCIRDIYLFVSVCCWDGRSITILQLLVQILRTFATVTILVCVLVNELDKVNPSDTILSMTLTGSSKKGRM